jgi:glycosyltransferase involved in cell wall biosynthesis
MGGEAISIIYATHRTEPRFEWLADSLALQLTADTPEVVIVDGLHSAERGRRFAEAANERFALRHVIAKPNPVNGEHRLTEREYTATASARNTGVVHSSRPYLVFVDDLAVLMPGWWEEVRTAAETGAVVGGAYQKHSLMKVSRGVLTYSAADPSGIDHRWDLGDDSAHVAIVGGQLFGCTLCVSRDALLAVNGFDEVCNIIAGEDYHLGIRLERAGERILYSRRMLSIEAGDLHAAEPVIKRIDFEVSEDAYMSRLRELGVERRSVNGSLDASHMVLDLLYGTDSNLSRGNYYELERLRPADLEATIDRFPDRFWFDQRPLQEL